MARILIVDDNLDLAENMNAYLKARSHDVTEVHSVTEAFDELSAGDFDLLLLDWELPDGDGIQVCKAYRDRDGRGGILMLTGRASAEDKVTGLTAGADDYLAKPFNIAEFGARVDAVLRRANAQKALEPIAFDESLVGKTLANAYEIESVLGKGAMGFVYKATHKTLKRVVAIKVLSETNIGVGARKRFEREAQAMSVLEHPNLVRIYEFGFAEKKVPYIVMEFSEGQALNLRIRRDGPIPLTEAFPLFIQICNGLEHAHEHGVIHRDLKPANIIASPDKKLKVVDLGLAKFTQVLDEDMARNNELTFAGEVFGSPAYMSPEQGTNRPLDQRSDVYALGCVMYEMLCGKLAFSAISFIEVMNEKMNSKPPSLCERFPELKIPPELDRCIRKAMDPSPTKRYGSMAELRAELLRIQESLNDQSRGGSKILSYVRHLFGKKK